ncbi:ankyrin repeat-containing domain protein [Chaetomium fimeti]|uniref:Ankyrin repeat-containing domain protein n=1 Tax=Chaetomium fimeti TaxID=1854472 RepID=A0AAE0LR11_9PEZI|nr:ankyrin repeat-containing domain protein [Chaetomium fimeti]
MNDIRIEDLPTDLLYQIIEHLLGERAFGSVVSFALCSRRFCGALSLLYKNVGRIRLEGEDALIWAAENGEFETLKALLENGVDPNARFWSTLPDCARQDVFAAQRGRRRLSPRLDGHLIAKLLQQDIVRHQRPRRGQYAPNDPSLLLQEWYLATMNGDMPEALDILHRDIAALVNGAHFGCCLSTPDLEHPSYAYSWTTLHVATKQGDERAVDLLLSHGADLESRCRGLCDCITPVYWKARQPPPSFSALHIAVCSGHEHLVRNLLVRGADPWLAGQMDGGVLAPVDADNGITVFHTAALQGNVAMCQFLLNQLVDSASGKPVPMLQRKDPRGLRALDYAVAAGHVRTTGRWLLCRGVSARRALGFRDRHFFPLNFLCYHGRYRDVQYLLRKKRPSPKACTLALQFCFMRQPTRPVKWTTTLGSLRAYLDEYMAFYALGKAPHVQPDSEEDLLSLIRQLLDRGANPGAALPLYRGGQFGEEPGKSALHLAASHGHRAALQAMLDAGAPLDHHVDFIPPWPKATGGTPLGCAMIPPPYSPACNDSRVYLGTIIFLLERGASFRNSLTREGETTFRDWFSPLFSHDFGGVPWYNTDHFDLFERVMGLVAKQLGEERFQAAWLTDLMDLAITRGTPNGNFCKWYVTGPSQALTVRGMAN